MLLNMVVVFTLFPFNHWRELWYRKLFEVPFVIIILIITVLFAVMIGIFISLYWKKQLQIIEEAVRTLEQGTNAKLEGPIATNPELLPIFNKLKRVKDYILEQTKRSQNLISERVKNQEEEIEKVVSQERNRLARELHDSVSQELFAASMMVSAINEMLPNQSDITAKQLKQVETMIQQAQLEMRALLLHLRPVPLKDKTLKEGMKQLLGELKQKVPIEVQWEIEQVSLSRGVEDHLFRILQESVSNTLRHSKAHSLDILLMQRDNFVILRVADDGVGFEVEEHQASSYGLSNMKERAAEIGATLRIISVPNKGTRLEVRVPIIDAEDEAHD
ncbi:sensor histidine kinase [Aquibacillus koreensis]|nr:sensor histidine kinase [Aquibacillus koreensis]